MYLRLSEAAAQLNVQPVTLRKYCNEGKIHYELTPGGQRIFTQEDINNFKGIKTDTNDNNNDNTAYYIRASDGNTNTLNNQLKELTQAYGPTKHIYKDKASGLNENRKGLKKLINDIEKGKIKHVKITYPDRLTRFGYTYLEHIITNAGADIEPLHTTNETPQEELMTDFMNLIASFSGKFYKMRSTENKKKLLQQAQEQLNNEEQTTQQ